MRIGLGRNGHPKNTHKIQKVSIVIKQKRTRCSRPHHERKDKLLNSTFKHKTRQSH